VPASCSAPPRLLLLAVFTRYDSPMTTPQELTHFEVTGNWVAVSAPPLASVNSDPDIEPVNGFVTFTPRLPRGMTFMIPDLLVTNAYNTLQQVWLLGNPVSGQWQLELATKTVSLAHSATAAAVEAALADLPGVGVGNVEVTNGDQPKSFRIEFVGDLAEVALPPLRSYSNLLNSAARNCPIAVTVIHQGTPQVVADTAVALPPITARIWRGRLSSINASDSPGVMLTANDPLLNNKDPLIYDVSFSQVTFNGEQRIIAPFAIVAPEVQTTICLTDPQLQRLPWASPISAVYSPSTTAAKTNNWRLRAV